MLNLEIKPFPERQLPPSNPFPPNYDEAPSFFHWLTQLQWNQSWLSTSSISNVEDDHNSRSGDWCVKDFCPHLFSNVEIDYLSRRIRSQSPVNHQFIQHCFPSSLQTSAYCRITDIGNKECSSGYLWKFWCKNQLKNWSVRTFHR